MDEVPEDDVVGVDEVGDVGVVAVPWGIYEKHHHVTNRETDRETLRVVSVTIDADPWGDTSRCTSPPYATTYKETELLQQQKTRE